MRWDSIDSCYSVVSVCLCFSDMNLYVCKKIIIHTNWLMLFLNIYYFTVCVLPTWYCPTAHLKREAGKRSCQKISDGKYRLTIFMKESPDVSPGSDCVYSPTKWTEVLPQAQVDIKWTISHVVLMQKMIMKRQKTF